MAQIAIIMAVASTAFGIFNQIRQSKIERQQLKEQERQLREQQARNAERHQQQQAELERRRRLALGRQRAEFASRGIDITSGAVLNTLNETIFLADQDSQALEREFKFAQADIGFSIAQTKQQRKLIKKNLPLNIGGTLLSTGAQAAKIGAAGKGPAPSANPGTFRNGGSLFGSSNTELASGEGFLINTPR